MAKLKLQLDELNVDTFDPAPTRGRPQGTVLARSQSEWGMCSYNDTCNAYCSGGYFSCNGSCDPNWQTCASCVATCGDTCRDSCGCTDRTACRCV